jgi:hypothetical protein
MAPDACGFRADAPGEARPRGRPLRAQHDRSAGNELPLAGDDGDAHVYRGFFLEREAVFEKPCAAYAHVHGFWWLLGGIIGVGGGLWWVSGSGKLLESSDGPG